MDVASFLASDPDDAPILRRYTVASATVEALAEKLIENPRGLLVVRDELPGWLAGLDREDAAELRAFLMTGWNGKDGWTFDRIGRGHRRVPAVCLGVIGGAQPGPLGEYLRAAMRGGASDDGMLARFGLLVWPETGGAWKNVDRYPDGPAKDAAFQVFEDLDALDPLARRRLYLNTLMIFAERMVDTLEISTPDAVLDSPSCSRPCRTWRIEGRSSGFFSSI